MALSQAEQRDATLNHLLAASLETGSHSAAVGAHLAATFLAHARSARQRIPPRVARRFCGGCGAVAIPGVTIRTGAAGRGRRAVGRRRAVTACLLCGETWSVVGGAMPARRRPAGESAKKDIDTHVPLVKKRRRKKKKDSLASALAAPPASSGGGLLSLLSKR